MIDMDHRLPTTALPVQVQRVYLSCTCPGTAPLARLSKVMELQTLGKTRWSFEMSTLNRFPCFV